MKLYATTTSERARKGQGGNDFINLAIHIDDKKNPRYRMYITKRKDDSTDVVLCDLTKPYPNEVYRDTIKGEKKKDECVHGVDKEYACKDCIYKILHTK